MDGSDDSFSPTSSRKRTRDTESDAQRNKREKAAERQRRKRERDRVVGIDSPGPGGPPMSMFPPVPSQAMPQAPLTPDEEARKERIRAAARERQRKHRRLVKQRKMHELGLDMGNEVMPGFEEAHFRVGPDGQYQQVLPPGAAPPEMHQQLAASAHQGLGAAAPAMQNGGQTFASTLLLSFSCAPLLKQHLLRNLNMTNEELASLEPIIADAWEQWNHQRQIHYGQAAAASGSSDGVAYHDHAPNGAEPNEFRARFQSQLTAPTPFHGGVPPPGATVVQQAPVVQSQGNPHLDPALASNPPTRHGSETRSGGAEGSPVNGQGEPEDVKG